MSDTLPGNLSFGTAGLLDAPVEDVLRPVVDDLRRSERDPRAVGGSAPAWLRDYELVRPLGRGGMGRTLLARAREGGQLVCIKELFEHVDGRMLLQEFRALSQVMHPNVVRVRGVEPDAVRSYIVSEYVNGPSISAYLRGRPRDERAIASLMQPVAEAVACLHAREIIHRDLKPDNVLVSDDGGRPRPVVIDLGLAIVSRYDFKYQITAAGPMIYGTPRYMAPEQFFGDVLTPACDVYALGTILFELATGGASGWSTISAKLGATTGLTLPDRRWWPRWRVLGRLIAACTHPDPASRPTADAVARGLARP